MNSIAETDIHVCGFSCLVDGMNFNRCIDSLVLSKCRGMLLTVFSFRYWFFNVQVVIVSSKFMAPYFIFWTLKLTGRDIDKEHEINSWTRNLILLECISWQIPPIIYHSFESILTLASCHQKLRSVNCRFIMKDTAHKNNPLTQSSDRSDITWNDLRKVEAEFHSWNQNCGTHRLLWSSYCCLNFFYNIIKRGDKLVRVERF